MRLYIQLFNLQLIIISIQVTNGSFISSILGAVDSLYSSGSGPGSGPGLGPGLGLGPGPVRGPVPQYLDNDHHHGIFIIIQIIFSLQIFISFRRLHT